MENFDAALEAEMMIMGELAIRRFQLVSERSELALLRVKVLGGECRESANLEKKAGPTGLALSTITARLDQIDAEVKELDEVANRISTYSYIGPDGLLELTMACV